MSKQLLIVVLGVCVLSLSLGQAIGSGVGAGEEVEMETYKSNQGELEQMEEEEFGDEEANELGASELGENGANNKNKKLFGRLNGQMREVAKTTGEGAMRVVEVAKPTLDNIKADSKDAYELIKNHPQVQKGVEYVKPRLDKARSRTVELISQHASKVPILSRFAQKRDPQAATTATAAAGADVSNAPVAAAQDAAAVEDLGEKKVVEQEPAAQVETVGESGGEPSVVAEQEQKHEHEHEHEHEQQQQ